VIAGRNGGSSVRGSAAIVALGLVLLGAVVLLNGTGLVPNRILIVLAWASPISIFGGLLIGIVLGTRRYRIAVALALLGTGLLIFGVMFVTTGGPGAISGPTVRPQEVAFWSGTGLWIVALVIGAAALRAGPETRQGA
jgi:hypothetical protein